MSNQRLTVEEINAAINAFTAKESHKFWAPHLERLAQQVGDKLAAAVSPVAQEVVNAAKESTAAAARLREQIEAERVVHEIEKVQLINGHVVANSKRNRKSAPATIRKNVEICRKRQENPNVWTLEKLREHYGFAHVRSVTKILNHQQKWLALAAGLGDGPN